MIVVDSSILIPQLRKPAEPVRKRLAIEDIAVCGVTRAEVLHGVQSDAQAEAFLHMLNGFPLLEMTAGDWDAVGLNLATFRRNGLVVPFQDAVVATMAMRADYELWCNDRHFGLMQAFLPALRLATNVS